MKIHKFKNRQCLDLPLPLNLKPPKQGSAVCMDKPCSINIDVKMVKEPQPVPASTVTELNKILGLLKLGLPMSAERMDACAIAVKIAEQIKEKSVGGCHAD